MTSDILEDIKKEILDKLPKEIQVSKVEFEGPEVVVYTKNPEIITENGDLIRSLAKELRKRIIIRSDKCALLEPEETINKIHEIVPEGAEITDIYFDTVTGEVVITAKKPGLVIGKYGVTSRNIVKNTGWAPKILRTPPISSDIIGKIRTIQKNSSKERKKMLQRLGRQIHQGSKHPNDWARVTSMGGFKEVGRSSMLLQTPNSRVLLDCGVNVAASDNKNAFPYLNAPEFSIEELDAVIISHAHLDHCGFVPYLYHYGYEGPVYCTTPTRDLTTLLQFDHLDIAHRDGDGAHNLVYTGDFKYEPSRLLEPATIRFPRAETVIMESTYGGKEDVQPSRNNAEKEMMKTIYRTLKRGGKVLVPVFAVGRAQELMVVLEEYMRHGLIEEVPIYIDGMIWEATAIHTARPEYLSKDLRDQIFHMGRNPFVSDMFEKVQNRDQRKEIVESRQPAIILSTSGMLTGGNSVEYFKWLCEDDKNTLIFVGYQSEGSMGRRVQKGWKEIPLEDDDGRTRQFFVKMEIKTINGFSGHSNRRQLMEYVKRLNPRPEKVITCHGDPYKAVDLASSIHRSYKIETKTPINLDCVRIQ